MFFLLVLLVSSLWKLFEKRQEIGEHVKGMEERVVKLRRENEEMEKVLTQAATPSFIEKEARRKLDMKKPGEKMVIIVPPKQTEELKNERTEEQKDVRGISWWQKIKRFLFP